MLEFAAAHAPAIFYVARFEGDQPITYISDNVEKLTGHRPADFMAKADYGRGFIHPDDLPDYRADLGRLRDENTLTHEYRFRTLDRGYRWYRDELRLADAGTFVGCMIDVTREKEQERRLSASEAIKSAIVATTISAIIVSDDDGRILEFNEAAVEMFGHTREAALGRRVGDLIVPDHHRASHEAAFERRVSGEATHDLAKRVELEARRADGELFPIELSISRATVEGREIFVAVMNDLSERIAAERERERISRLFQDAVESLEGGFSIVDADGILVACNSALTCNMKLDPARFVGQPREVLVRQVVKRMRRFDGQLVGDSDEWVDRVTQAIDRADSRGIEVEFEGGRWVLLSSQLTSDGSQVTLATEITQLKSVELELRASEQRFRALVEENPLPLFLVDLETAEILYASPAAARIVGLDWPLAAAATATSLYVSPEERDEFVSELRRLGAVDDLEIRFRQGDGKAIWVSLSSRMIVYQGREVAVTGLVDLTVRKRREGELRQAQETLEDAIESLSEGFALYDPDDCLVLCNKQFLAYNHMSADLFRPGRSWMEITRDRLARGQFPNAVGREEEWLSERLLERGNIDMEEFPVSDGRWYEHSHRRTRQGGLVLTWREITERKEMQQALEESAARVRRILEACPAAITVSTADEGRVIFETPTTRALFHRTEDEHVTDGAELYDDPSIRERGIRHLRAGGSIDNVEVEFRRRDDTHFHAAVSARLIELDDEEAVVAIPTSCSTPPWR